jgi:hypothetical protein
MAVPTPAVKTVAVLTYMIASLFVERAEERCAPQVLPEGLIGAGAAARLPPSLRIVEKSGASTKARMTTATTATIAKTRTKAPVSLAEPCAMIEFTT